jgi:hypothetical protein
METETSNTHSKRRWWFLPVLLTFIVLFVLMQFARFVVPPFKISNPPSRYTVQWDSPRTQSLWQKTCGDCHSNETVWPWYSYVAPFGWLIAYDVNQGRDEFNISDGDSEDDEIAEVIRDGEMPPAIYLIIHNDAKLSEADKNDLISGLRSSLGSSDS